jgi:hypothetical protein
MGRTEPFNRIAMKGRVGWNQAVGLGRREWQGWGRVRSYEVRQVAEPRPFRGGCHPGNYTVRDAMLKVMAESVRSAGFDRQRLVARPLTHRGIIQRDVVVTELVQQVQVDGRRNAAAAIDDDVFVRRDALSREPGPRIG